MHDLAILLINVYSNQMNKTNTHGGARPGSGRKPNPDTLPSVPVTIRMSEPQKDKLQQLGGAPWVRDKIDKAKLPPTK